MAIFLSIHPLLKPGVNRNYGGLSLSIICSSACCETIKICSFHIQKLETCCGLLCTWSMLKHHQFASVIAIISIHISAVELSPWHRWYMQKSIAHKSVVLWDCHFTESRHNIKCMYLWIILGMFWVSHMGERPATGIQWENSCVVTHQTWWVRVCPHVVLINRLKILLQKHNLIVVRKLPYHGMYFFRLETLSFPPPVQCNFELWLEYSFWLDWILHNVSTSWEIMLYLKQSKVYCLRSLLTQGMSLLSTVISWP